MSRFSTSKSILLASTLGLFFVACDGDTANKVGAVIGQEAAHLKNSSEVESHFSSVKNTVKDPAVFEEKLQEKSESNPYESTNKKLKGPKRQDPVANYFDQKSDVSLKDVDFSSVSNCNDLSSQLLELQKQGSLQTKQALKGLQDSLSANQKTVEGKDSDKYAVMYETTEGPLKIVQKGSANDKDLAILNHLSGTIDGATVDYRVSNVVKSTKEVEGSYNWESRLAISVKEGKNSVLQKASYDFEVENNILKSITNGISLSALHDGKQTAKMEFETKVKFESESTIKVDVNQQITLNQNGEDVPNNTKESFVIEYGNGGCEMKTLTKKPTSDDVK